MIIRIYHRMCTNRGTDGVRCGHDIASHFETRYTDSTDTTRTTCLVRGCTCILYLNYEEAK